MKFVLILVACTALQAADITWTLANSLSAQMGGYLGIRYDSFSQSTLFMIPDNAGISTGYANSMWYFVPNRNTPTSSTFTELGTTGDTADNCTTTAPFTRIWTGTIAGTGPSMRHPIHQHWVDTANHRFYQIGGVCSGVTPTGGAGAMMYMPIGSPATSSQPWVNVSPAHFPNTGVILDAGCTYDPVDIKTVCFGSDGGSQSHDFWIYSVASNDWVEPAAPGGGWVPGTNMPPGVQFPSCEWDPLDSKIVCVGGLTGGGVEQNQTWSLDVPSFTWTKKANMPVACATQFCGWIWNSNVNQFYFHFAANTTSGSNTCGGNNIAANYTDYTYTYGSNTWSAALVSTTSGVADPACTESMAYDPISHALILYANNSSQGSPGQILIGTISADPSISVPITIQEALPINLSNCTSAGSCGIARSGEAFRTGVPLPDNDIGGLTSISTAGLTSCTASQFRSLVTWPSGRIKWIEVEGTVSSLTAGGTTTCTFTNGGSGNGTGLATDNGTTISIVTGTATYTIKKANFNLIDIGAVGATSIIATSSSASRGLVLLGPANPGTTCGTCTTVFSSANDASSTASIEENGTVQAVIKATGALKDGSGNVYVRFTARMYFNTNRNGFRVHVSLQNADDSANGSFATAFKGFASFYAQLDMVSLGTMNYRIGGRAGTLGPTAFSAAETASVVQLYSNWMQDRGFGDPGEWDTSALPTSSTQTIIPRTSGGGCSDAYCYPDNGRANEGYAIKDGATSLETGTRAQIPAGWADTANGSGVGMMAGVSYLSAYWPKSVELQNGGNTVAVGIWPSEISGFNWWICYTCYQVSDFYLEPHSSNPASLSNDFLSYQYDLIGRTPIAQYNTAAVFPWGSLPDSTTEDNYWTNMSSVFAGTGSAPNPAVSVGKLCCANDSISGATSGPYIFRYYAFGATGGINESDISESYLLNFITRGETGKYVFGRFREQFIEESVFPRSDFAGGWRSKTFGVELGAVGFPTGVSSANSSNVLQSWTISPGGFEQHSHFYAMPTWYYATGEEHYADTIKQGYYDWATNANVPEGGCSVSCSNDLQFPSVPRAIGPKLVFAARIHDFAASIGDSTTAANAYTVAEQVLTKAVRPVLVSPKISCTATNCQGAGDYGTDRNRGLTSAMAFYQGWNQPQLQQIGIGNAATTVFNFTLAGSPTARYPIECGGPAVFPTITITAGSVVGHDDTGCVGTITGTGIASGSVTYSTGAGTVTFSVAPANGVLITAYFFYPTSAALAPNNTAGNARVVGTFQQNLLINGELEYAKSRGPTWSGYEDLLDLAYGGAQNFVKNEATMSGSGIWTNDGILFGIILDFCNDPQVASVCHAEGPHNVWWANPATSAPPSGQQTVWWAFQQRNDYFGDRTWIADWQANMYQVLQSQSLAPNGMTEYARPDLSALIYRALNPGPALNDIQITGFSDQGAGNYLLSWTVPANLTTPKGLTTPYKFKWGSLQIVASMQFDSAETNTYGQSTVTKMPWFAATNVSNEPVPLSTGSTQSYTFVTGTTGLTQANFSLKTYQTIPNTPSAMMSGLFSFGATEF